MNKRLIAERFSKAITTYPKEANVQRQIAGKMIRLLTEHIPSPCSKVIEFGCGTGIYSRMLLQALRPEELLLNDLCPDMKYCCEDLLMKKQVSFLPGDAETVSFPTESTLITSCSALQWFESPENFFERCNTLLNNQGYFAFSTFGKENMKEIRELTGNGLPYRSREELDVFTFKNHPQELFGKKILRLCSNETRAALMRRQGIELVDEVEFTSAIRDLSAESFIRMLAERLNPKIIVAGFNYTFGKKKQGNSETLQRLCQKYGIKTAIIQPVLLGREPVSSTRVRNMITCGNVQDAQLLLGRAYALDGIIVQNKRIGRTIGYPTANIEPDSARVIPADGVYVSMARVNGDIMPACTNIGTNPTVGGTKRTIETHIFDYDEDIYGLPMTVCFVKKIRDVKKFESLDALKEQIRIDAGIARTYFGC